MAAEAAGAHWQLKSNSEHPCAEPADMMHCWPHDGIALAEAMHGEEPEAAAHAELPAAEPAPEPEPEPEPPPELGDVVIGAAGAEEAPEPAPAPPPDPPLDPPDPPAALVGHVPALPGFAELHAHTASAED